ncbi:peptide deformylase [Isoptericola sp. b441]|uniref:Peptide deformylase n=1 Tax=Actinotalea lenta TaxID=3064654 RepID=A0ABT9D4T4_9CELL|nr:MULTISPECIES: peptide deformylase [unclassified Isoptericola]MDO8105691.1 peptide deformylase [Isoptericola sp. b441]MDO8122396.1 peptide deformylase [Isoptericola sp. b490]
MTLADQVGELLAGPRPLPIVQAGHPVLRRVAEPWTGQLPGPLLGELIEAMRETMHAAPGVGLAAPQVGLSLALAVLEDTWVAGAIAEARERTALPFRVLVNPRYEPVGERRVAFFEGCLSVAGYQAVTPRWHAVRLTGQDETGAALDEVLTGWPARIVQHETDHLNGRLYLDGAELRSLVAPSEATRYLGDPTPARAATELGFPLP